MHQSEPSIGNPVGAYERGVNPARDGGSTEGRWGLQTAARKPDYYPIIKFVELNNFVLSTFPGENELKDERNCYL